jgi:RNA polymerase sigma-70 factor, ECF subfamily
MPAVALPDVRAAAEAVFRRESGQILASLIRVSGSFDRAEEALQEALVSALASWPDRGLPDNPGAWIMTAAYRKLIDGVRKERTRREKQDSLLYETAWSVSLPDPEFDDSAMSYPDDRLRLMFTCCHPALNREAQVALTLRTLGGLSTPEIAKAFLLPEATLAQRIVRAKRKIQEARIPYQVPRPDRLQERLASVQAVIYLIFNEGYAAAAGHHLVRGDLCAEAIRLGRMLCDLLPREAENLGLLALMLLHDSRRDARMAEGALVTLEDQDRSLWDRGAIAEGLLLLENALRIGRGTGQAGTYRLQAAIAALHAQAARPEETDWPQIAALYEKLVERNPHAVIALNHAVAIAMSVGFEEGLARIDALGAAGALDSYYLFHAARADLLRRLGRPVEAAAAYRQAASLAANRVERDFLERRLREIESKLARD